MPIKYIIVYKCTQNTNNFRKSTYLNIMRGSWTCMKIYLYLIKIPICAVASLSPPHCVWQWQSCCVLFGASLILHRSSSFEWIFEWYPYRISMFVWALCVCNVSTRMMFELRRNLERELVCRQTDASFSWKLCSQNHSMILFMEFISENL